MKKPLVTGGSLLLMKISSYIIQVLKNMVITDWK